MSERGSFVTSYMYCEQCLQGAASILCENSKSLTGRQILSWEGNGKLLPIIAGKVGGSYAGEELIVFEDFLVPLVATVICHRVWIAVLPDQGEPTVFQIDPKNPAPPLKIVPKLE